MFCPRALVIELMPAVKKNERFFVCLWQFQALDTFNTAVVSPIYYAMFTTFTILASAIMFKVRCF